MIRLCAPACLIVASLALIPTTAYPADLVVLSPQTWDRYAPHGKEVDAIYGDFVLSNGKILAVVAQPKRGRNANMTVRDVGGCLIDLTVKDHQSDQLSAFYPGAHLRDLSFAGIDVAAPSTYEVAELDRVFVQARRVTLRLAALPREREPDVEVEYTLEDGWPSVLVTTTFINRGETPVDSELVDAIRADRTFEFSPDGASDLFWAYDKHFGQAYGVVAEGRQILPSRARQFLLRYPDKQGKVAVRLAPGETVRLSRRIIPGANLFDIRGQAAALAGKPSGGKRLRVIDTSGHAVRQAEVTLECEGKPYAWGRTDAQGRIEIPAGDGPGRLIVSALGYGSKTVDLGGTGRGLPDEVELPAAGRVLARITDDRGAAIPCKVQFIGRDGLASPDFGPDSGDHAVKNVVYDATGRFTRILPAGSYDVIVSHGPEFDAFFTKLEIAQGKETRLEGKLVRSVKTDGWISADFHSHSSPSGDNTSSQLGRVLNLLCEHIEFAPCTEHNRLSTYAPHLRRLGAEKLMATCVGIELTGSPLPLNHQNAFPLVLRPHKQDGGAPTADADPAIQIERLALWDQGSDKLVQVNHPDIGWMFHDRNGDGQPDQGFSGMFGRIDVIEVHPPHWIFAGPKVRADGQMMNNTISNWIQLLNQGRRIPGVINTDAHENFHGSGWLRNYVKSPTDDPAKVKTLEVVHAAEQGHLVMTNGPFLEVRLKSGSIADAHAGPGDSTPAAGGKAVLQVRVQCPNWFDVDRVQVFLNGRADERLNFTRKATPDRFSSVTVKFDQEIPLELKTDAHIIVAAIGEQSKLGPVMGPDHAGDLPVAVSNPIFVDVDGGGFKPDPEAVGTIPVKGGQ
jgi:hypothetical protein